MRRAFRRQIVLIAGGLLLAAGVAAGPDLVPVSLSTLGSGEPVILDSHRGLFQYSPGSRKVTRLIEGFGIFEAMDVNVVSLEGSESVLVTLVPTSASVGARLLRYDLKSKARVEWNLPPWKGRCSGVAVDPQALMAYVACFQSSEIFRFDLRKPGSSPVPLAKIPGAVALAPMIFDRGHRRLLVGDSLRGVVVGVDIDSGRSEILVRNVGDSSALALDAEARVLFIADAAGRRVRKVDLGRDAKPKVFAELKEFREPIGLALAADGSLWVGDHGAKAIFLLSKEGKVLPSSMKF